MAKTNFTKVEDMLNQGLHKITVDHLLSEADAAKGIIPKQSVDDHRSLISSLQRDLKLLHKKDRETYAKLGIKKTFLKKAIETPEALTPEDVDLLKQVQEKIKIYKEELKTKIPQVNDDTLIQAQRSKHINKRYNVNDKWLPLQ